MAPRHQSSSDDQGTTPLPTNAQATSSSASPSPPSSPSHQPSPAPVLDLTFSTNGARSEYLAPDVLPMDHTLPHLLRQVTGTESLRSVRELKLRVVAWEMSLQRLCLYVPTLRELCLDGSCLGSLRDLGCGLGSLHVLSVNHCGLDTLDGTFGLSNLRELSAVGNRISDVGSVTFIPRIRKLDVRRNNIRDLFSLSFLSSCKNLENLSLSECPVASSTGYRDSVREMLPQLLFLDGIGFLENVEDKDIQSEPEDYNTTDTEKNVEKLEIEEDVSETHPKTTVSTRPESAKTVTYSVEEKRKRPSTSVPTASVPIGQVDSVVDCGHVDQSPDAPSTLTSGHIVCGNLTASLRGRRRHQEAWNEPPAIETKKAVPTRSSSESTLKLDESTKETSTSAPSKGTLCLLEASRQWREKYSSYRSEHMEQWDKETKDNANSDKLSVKSSVGGKMEFAVSMHQQPCCAAALITRPWKQHKYDPEDEFDDDVS